MNNYIIPNWPAPKNINAYTTTRLGGVSKPPYHSFNLSLTTGDQLQAVNINRQKLYLDLKLPQKPFWLTQKHTNKVIYTHHLPQNYSIVADASISTQFDHISIVTTADCIPILICDLKGTVVAAIHAGWRGIADDIVANTIEAMEVAPSQLMAWLGPAIGPSSFIVDQKLQSIFCQKLSKNHQAFTKHQEQFLANIFQLAKNSLNSQGVTKVYGGSYCTFTQKELFYSYRRDGKQSGRMASLIWLSKK